MIDTVTDCGLLRTAMVKRAARKAPSQDSVDYKPRCVVMAPIDPANKPSLSAQEKAARSRVAVAAHYRR